MALTPTEFSSRTIARGARILCFVVFATIVGVFTIHIVRHPAHNWDIVAYVGCVHALQHSDPVEIHRQTFADLRENVPENMFRSLTTGSDYVVTMASDPIAFHQQLPFYRVKLLYVGLLYLLTTIGFDASAATIAVSAGSFVITALIGYLWIVRYVPGTYGLVLATLSVITPPVLHSAALSTPDSLSTALLLAGLYLLLEKQTKSAAVPFVLCLLIRPDNVLFLALLLTGLRFVRTSPVALTNLQYLAGSAGLVALYAMLNLASGGYGWKMLFEHSFVAKISYPGHHVPAVTVGDYVKTLFRTGEALTRTHVFIYLIPAIFSVWLQRRFQLWNDESLRFGILYVILASIGVRLLVHPAAVDRFFVAHCLTIEFICIALIRRLVEQLPSHTVQAVDRALP
jgi:hypothetical protein